MNTFKNIFWTSLFVSAALTGSVRAEIYLDHEHDPLPMFEMTVVIPVGFEARSPQEAGIGNLLSDIIEGGTAKMDRQAFQEKIAEFGANLDFSVANQYSEYTLSFPIVAGKNYDALIGVLKENWQTPRFEEKTFEIAKTKVKAALQAGLDSDFALAASTARRWLNTRSFGGYPVFLDTIDQITLPKVIEVFQRDFLKGKHIWVGVVAPESSLALTKKLLSEVFSGQGEIIVGEHIEKLPTLSAKTKYPRPQKEALIIDKDQRTQTVTSVIAIGEDPLKGSDDLAFTFGNHVLFDSGLASIFSDEIRTKRGLAYSVGSGLKDLFERPVISVSMNPVREKNKEALEVLSKMLKSSFEDSTQWSEKELPADVYDRQIRSFKNSKILSQATPSSRLALRASVITGAMTEDFYFSDPATWNPKREDLSRVLSKLWKHSHIVLSVIGEASEIRPLIEKNFPEYKITVIPYKETVLQKTYR